MKTEQLNLIWTAPRLVNTRRGARSLSTATPNEDFWAAYKADKDALREAGITLSRDPDGQWQVCRWALPEQQEPVAPVSGADLNIPAPDGLAYMPFQRDGIAFMAKRFGDI